MPSVSDFDRFLPATWDVQHLSSIGYAGWRPFADRPTVDVPRSPGVYVVARNAASAPAFLERSPAGWFKGVDPTVPVARLNAEWLPGECVVYIGKADNLSDRLDLYRRFGVGEPEMHKGGRLIWQLADSSNLHVAWLVTPGFDPEDVEYFQLEHFRCAHNERLPFANLRRDRRPRWL